jgi:hypothetical protein
VREMVWVGRGKRRKKRKKKKEKKKEEAIKILHNLS